MHKIWEFVITGGPCGGKTTGLSKLEQIFTDKGFKVLVVSETATEVIISGVNGKEVPIIEFQRVIIERGINKEKTIRRVAEFFNKDVIIFYDRGLPDSIAYMEKKDYIKILKTHKLSEVTVRDRYDGVFHLITAAIGAEKYYTKENNKARQENLQEAIDADRRTLDAWLGHPHLRIIDNSTNFSTKIDRLIREVHVAMGIPTPTEIERKFLIKRPTIKELEAVNSVKSNIVQTYLKRKESAVERRVRQRGTSGDYCYYYTEKKEKASSVRDEIERKISKDEYIQFLVEGINTVTKDRYCFFYESQYFELDIYPDWEDTAILEIELTEEGQEVKIPDWITVIEEVTDNKKYRNANL